MVIKVYNDEILFCVDEKVYALDELPAHELTSKHFDLAVSSKKPRKRYMKKQ